MSTQSTEPTVDVDANDDNDDHATEIAVAAAMTAALAHPANPATMTVDQAESIIEATVGNILRFYAIRVLDRVASVWRSGRPVDAEVFQTIQQSVAAGLRKAVDDTGDSVREIVQAAANRITEGRARPSELGTVIEGGRSHEDMAYVRLREGLESVSRLLVTRSREEAKYAFAQRVSAYGKVWRTRRDNAVRTSHSDLEGEFEPLDAAFTTIRGARLQRPGDPAAPLREIINCRCRLSYRMKIPA